MAQEVEKLAVALDAKAATQESPRGGITAASVCAGSVLFLALAWGLAHWSLTKSYTLGMGGYLPLEAFILTLLLLVFNRFGGAFVMVAGIATTAVLTPFWHAAVYAKTIADVSMLPAASAWLYRVFSGVIEPARESEWAPAMLVAAGVLLAFAAGALPALLGTVAAPVLRRRLVWREMLVIFVLVSVGIYSCRAVASVVGILTVPYKDDDQSRDFKRFVRPVPKSQDPENRGGIPSKLVPYDPSDFDLTRADPNTAEGRAIRAGFDEEKSALDKFRKGFDKISPEPAVVEQLLAEADAVGAWLDRAGSSGGDAEVAKRLAAALRESRSAFERHPDLKTLAGFQNSFADAQMEKSRTGSAAGSVPQTVDASKYAGRGRAMVFAMGANEREVFMARWKRPLVWWLSLLALIMLVQVFLAAMLRRQWSDHEKLMFPHAEVVRALAEGSDLSSKSRRVLSSPMLWIGASLAAVVFLFQGLNNYFPAVPAPNLYKISLDTFISERPWTAMQRELNLQPYLLSISYLLTSEVSLSIWIFGVINQVLRVAASAWGLPRDDAWAIHGELANSDALYAGAMLLFVAWLVWGGRRHIWYVMRRGLGLAAPDADERSEPMSYATAFWGFWLCVAGILLWCVLAGLKLWIMAVLFGLYLALVVLISRLVSEAGLMTAGASFWPFYPQFAFCWIFGFGQGVAGKLIAYKDGWLGAGGASIPVTLRAFGVWSFIWPSMLHILPLSPFLLTGFKLTETEPRRKRLLTWLMVAAVAAGAALFLSVTLSMAFHRGAQGADFSGGKGMANWVFNNWLMRDVVNKERMWTHDLLRMGMMGAGAAVMGGLLIFRSLFYWWPLHPIGMAATGIDGIWVCFLLGWIFKRAALAYGGGEFSQRINPFFYGLIVGQFAMAAFWVVVGLCGKGCMPMGPLLPGMD